MITASGEQEKMQALEAGADDFVTKPFDQAELLARVASLARVKRYQDTVRRQAAELAEWNAELDRPGATPRSRSWTGSAGSAGSSPRSWRIWSWTRATSRSCAATAARSSSSSATCGGSRRSPRPASPRRSWRCSATYHRALGELIHRYRGDPGAVHRRRVDGVLQRPAALPGRAARAVRMAVAMRDRVRRPGPRTGPSAATSSRSGSAIAQGYATLGRIGFEGRYDYAAIGSVTNLAARLCDEAEPWQVLVTRRVLAAAGDGPEARPLGDLQLRGFSRPFPVFDVLSGGVPPGP